MLGASLNLWIALGVFIAAVVLVGILTSRKAAQGAEFWTADRSLSASSVGLSISAGFMSVSWSCVYTTQLFWSYGLGGIWLVTVPWLLALGGIFLLARRYRALPAFSQPEMVGQRFGEANRRVVAFAVAFVFLVWGGAEIHVAATLLAPGLGLAVPTAVVLISAVVAVYSTLGGLSAVVTTDKMQYFLVALYIGAITVLAARGLHAQGHWLPAAEIHAGKSGLPWTHWLAPGWATILLTFLAYLPGWLFEADLWVKVQAARDDRAARRGMLLAGANAVLFVGLLPLFIGVAALSLFPVVDGVPPAALGREGDAVFSAIVTHLAPGWLAPLMGIGLVAAAMSTIDTCSNVMGLAIAYDLLRVQERSDSTRRSRWVNLATMAASCLFALSIDSLWDMFYLSGGILTASVALPIAAVFWPKARRRGVLLSSVFGLAATVCTYMLESHGPLKALEPAWLGGSGLGFVLWGLAGALVGYAVGALSERRAPSYS